MKQPKLFVDEDACNHVVVAALRRLGIDALTVLDAGRLGGDDADQLRFAASLERVFYSLNVSDFTRIHGEFLSAGDEHWGVIVIPRQRHSIGGKIHKLHKLLDATDADQLRNTIHFIYKTGAGAALTSRPSHAPSDPPPDPASSRSNTLSRPR